MSGTPPVIEAGFLAPIVARVEKIEAAVVLLEALLHRLMGDTVELRDIRDEIVREMRELRATLRGRS